MAYGIKNAPINLLNNGYHRPISYSFSVVSFDVLVEPNVTLNPYAKILKPFYVTDISVDNSRNNVRCFNL